MKTKKSTAIISLMTVVLLSCTTPRPMTNFVAIMEVKTPIKGVCDNSKVYALLPIAGNGQVIAVASKADTAITRQLNADVTYLKNKTDYSDKGMVNLIVNCKGALVQCEIDNKTKSPQLDSEIVAVFSKLKEWTPGSINGNSVDCSVLYSFTIKNGKIAVD